MADEDPSLPASGSAEMAKEIAEELTSRYPALDKPEVAQTIRTVVEQKSQVFVGPHPPPQLLKEYEDVCPGWAVRLMEQGERRLHWEIQREQEQLAQTKQVLDIEAEDRRAGRSIERWGLTLGFAALLLFAGIGSWALWLGHAAVALTCFSTSVIGVVGLLVTRSWRPKPEESTQET